MSDNKQTKLSEELLDKRQAEFLAMLEEIGYTNPEQKILGYTTSHALMNVLNHPIFLQDDQLTIVCLKSAINYVQDHINVKTS